MSRFYRYLIVIYVKFNSVVEREYIPYDVNFLSIETCFIGPAYVLLNIPCIPANKYIQVTTDPPYPGVPHL